MQRSTQAISGVNNVGIQLGVVDTTICMGASITGPAAGSPILVILAMWSGTIGDFTFLPTGIEGLHECGLQWCEHDGCHPRQPYYRDYRPYQPNPNTGATATGVDISPCSLDAICRAGGATFVETVDPYDMTGILRVLEEAKKKKRGSR